MKFVTTHPKMRHPQMLDTKQSSVLEHSLSVHGALPSTPNFREEIHIRLRQVFSMHPQWTLTCHSPALVSWVPELQTCQCVQLHWHNSMKDPRLPTFYSGKQPYLMSPCSCDYKMCTRWWPFFWHSPFSWALGRVSRSIALCIFVSIMGRKLVVYFSLLNHVTKQIEAIREGSV